MSEDVLGQPWEEITSGPITERCQITAGAFDVEEPLESCSLSDLNMSLNLYVGALTADRDRLWEISQRDSLPKEKKSIVTIKVKKNKKNNEEFKV